MSEITLEYVKLCEDEMNALGEASRTLVLEIAKANLDGTPMTQFQINLRRAQLYRQHLDAAGIEIVRINKEVRS